MKKLFANKARTDSFINYAIVIVFFLVFQTMISTGHITNSLKGQLVPICVYIVMALSLNLVVGISGELSLGHAGFMSVGAFTAVIVASSLQDTISSSLVRLILAILVGAVFAIIASVIVGIPVLRLRGDYLAIVTLAFGEIIKNILNCLYVGYDESGVHFSFTDSDSLGLSSNGSIIINGPMGALSVTKIASFGMGVVLILLALFVIQNLINSRTGRAVKAIRDNRIAAEACGLNVTKYKLMAFMVSAALAGMAGALYGLNYSTIVPSKFDFNTSILVLVFVVLGGIGNLRGSMIAAALLTVLPELLRSVGDYRMLIYAVVLILVMIITNNAKAKELLAKVTGIFSKKTQEVADNE